MERTRMGAVLAAAGAVVLALSLLADVLGYGSGGFGWKQAAGTAVGAVALVAGLALALRGRRLGSPAAGG